MLFSWFWLSLFRYNFSESIQSCYLVLPGYLVFNAFDVFFVFSLWTRSRSPCWCSSIVIGSSCLPGFTEFFVATSSQSHFKKKPRNRVFVCAFRIDVLPSKCRSQRFPGTFIFFASTFVERIVSRSESRRDPMQSSTQPNESIRNEKMPKQNKNQPTNKGANKQTNRHKEKDNLETKKAQKMEQKPISILPNSLSLFLSSFFWPFSLLLTRACMHFSLVFKEFLLFVSRLSTPTPFFAPFPLILLFFFQFYFGAVSIKHYGKLSKTQ